MVGPRLRLSRGEPGYPSRLLDLPEPPAELEVEGELPTGAAVGVVGARAADETGLRVAGEIAFGLARAGVTVVSGGAVGVDQAAHRGALEAGGRTVLVLPCGLDVEYPPGSGELRARVAVQGAVVTELPAGTPPLPSRFRSRNRIIAALAQAVVVVQAAARSGSLVTARLAKQLGRPLLAVPGVPGGVLSQGTHSLLRGGAVLAESSADVLGALGLDPGPVRGVPVVRPGADPPGRREGGAGGGATAAEPLPGPMIAPAGLAARLHDLLRQGSTPADVLARALGRPVGDVLAALVELEIAGCVTCRGGCYERRG